jgi:V/A-type H+-transporting ATPase subunit D
MMPIRVPAGRAGRLWLRNRIEVARHGADILDEKRQALVRELLRLRGLVDEAETDWSEAAPEATAWLRRAAVMGGERPLQLARLSVGETAGIELAWRNALGVTYPSGARLVLPRGRPSAAASTAALLEAAEAHRRALEVAAQLGVLRLARDRIEAELARTIRRLRAIQHRWLPRHEQALRELEVLFDEREREEAAQIRWALQRAR